MTPALRRRCARALHLVKPGGEVVRAGGAVVAAVRELGWRRTAALWEAPPLRWLLEAGYWLVARNRALVGRLLPKRK